MTDKFLSSGIGLIRIFTLLNINSINMAKDRNFLKGMANRFGLGSMVTNMATAFLPQFAEQLQLMEQPESEGGLLKEGETKMAFVLTQVNGQMIITTCSLTYDPDHKRMIMNQPISNEPLADLLNRQNEENNGNEQN